MQQRREYFITLKVVLLIAPELLITYIMEEMMSQKHPLQLKLPKLNYFSGIRYKGHVKCKRGNGINSYYSE